MRGNFRVWDNKDNRYDYGDFFITTDGELLKDVGSYSVEVWYCEHYEPGRYIVEWCTDLKDKHGGYIYEGDIAIHKDYECLGYVVFSDDESAFALLVVTGSNNKGLTTEFEWLYDYADGLEIIGNIHENPELLKER